MTPDTTRRLSGNQIVVIALALCAALVLAPVGVYAAKVQKVKVVGTVPTKAQGTVPTQEVVRAGSFVKTFTGSGVFSLTSLFGSASAIQITSVTVANTGTVPLDANIPTYSDSACNNGTGEVALQVIVPREDTRTVTYPVPVRVSPKCSVMPVLGATGAVTITGYRG